MSTHTESEKCQTNVQEELSDMCESIFEEYQAKGHVSRHVQASRTMFFMNQNQATLRHQTIEQK